MAAIAELEKSLVATRADVATWKTRYDAATAKVKNSNAAVNEAQFKIDNIRLEYEKVNILNICCALCFVSILYRCLFLQIQILSTHILRLSTHRQWSR